MMTSNLSPGLQDDPRAFPRRILLAVCGLSPQIVTETVYALAKGPTAFVPTEIHLITTREGARRAEETLMGGGQGWLPRLVQDHGLAPITFDRSHIHVLQTPQGQDLDDIRTPEDNQIAADFIIDVVRAHTRHNDAALHVSIAGGRKTMGFYLGYALSLYGRHCDRLSHVLVDSDYESCPDFFYPTPYSHAVVGRQKQSLDASKARVELAEIPFVSLRHGMPEQLLTGSGTRFNEAVQAIRAMLNPPQLRIDLARRRIMAAGIEVELSPAELAFYLVFVRRAQQQQAPLPAPSKGVPCEEWAARFLSEYRRIGGKLGGHDSTFKTLDVGMDNDYFSLRKTRLQKAMKKKLGPASKPYLIERSTKRPAGYSLNLPADVIAYVGDITD